MGNEESFAEEVMLELGLDGKVFFKIKKIFFFLPDTILGLEWDPVVK